MNEVKQSRYFALARIKDNPTEEWQFEENYNEPRFVEFLKKELEYAKKFKLVADEAWLSQSLEMLKQIEILNSQQVNQTFKALIEKLKN